MRLLIAGAGGHAKVVLDAAIACGFEIAGVVGKPDGAPELLGHAVTYDASAIEADGFIAAIGDNATRAREYARLVAAGLTPTSVIHPSAVISDGVSMGPGTFVAAGVVVNIGTRVGENAILNTGCTVDHDCEVGAHVLIGPGVNLCGGVRVGTGTLIGVGACMIPLARVGEWSTVGAGAVVTTDLPARATCVGMPAAPVNRSGAAQ